MKISHAIINMDDEQYRLTMRRREMMKSQRNEINTLKQEVTDIKNLLKEIIEKLHGKTVDNFSTIEDFRKTYNELAFDVGEKDGLRDALKLGTNGYTCRCT